ncbi:MAG: HDOD domain-containing protein [Gammaproteobacteria bacterium]|nr:HDOD domain-containing protein [Gammaproteobacteria bacterium]
MAATVPPPLTQTDMASIVAETTTLVSLPSVCVKINELIERNNYTTAEIGSIISKDVNLTARLLHVANSAFYGFPAKINTVSRAVTIIGSRELRDLVLATSAVEAFNKIPIDMANMNSFWMHSLDCAILARILASRAKVLHSERLFVCGILHDVGHLVMYMKLPERARAAMVHAAKSHQFIEVAERELIGFDHAQLGGSLLLAWQLHESLAEPVLYHHDPFAAPNFQLEATIIYLANSLAKASRIGGTLSHSTDIDQRAWTALNLTPGQVPEILQEAKQQFGEALSVFLPHLAQAQ